jgi:nucleoside-diphosphate-sugar epimerase
MNKRILITGAGGFIGTALVKSLKNELGIEVIPHYREDGDLINYDNLVQYQDEKFDSIVHLASDTFVPRSWDEPRMFFSNNITYTLNLLELSRLTNARFLYLSSYLYGKPDSFPTSETAQIKTPNPYSASKYLSEQLIIKYSNLFGFPYTIVRPFNLYGPGQKKNFFIPEMIMKVLSNTSDNVEVFDLEPKRDYLYISDFIELMVCMIKKPVNGIFNAGYGRSYSVKEVLDTIFRVTGVQKEIVEVGRKRKNEIPETVADISLVEEVFSWRPTTSLEKGLSNQISQLR